MNETKPSLEQISALADGQLRGEEFSAVIGQIGVDPKLREAWRTYHVVGDVLRSGAHAPCADSDAFMARLQKRLATEPMARPATPPAFVAVKVEAANEPVFRWKLVAGAASLAAAAAIGWTWVGMGSGASGPQLAMQQDKAPSVLALASTAATGPSGLTRAQVMVGNGNAQVMLRDPRLDRLLEAHQQAGGASQMPSSFLRNATFEAPSR